MKGKIGDKQRLLHILESISEIERYVSGADFNIFCQHSMMRFATIKQIEIIGEAANAITEDTRIAYNQIQWRQIIGLRHILVHEYFGIDNTLVWQIVSNDIPVLKQEITKLLTSIDTE